MKEVLFDRSFFRNMQLKKIVGDTGSGRDPNVVMNDQVLLDGEF